MDTAFAFDDVALVSVTYKSSQLASHFANTARNFRHVWIIDNDSQDQTASVFQHAIPHANVIALERYIGFGPANNIGFRASRTCCPRVLFMNPDCAIDAEAVALLLAVLETHPKAGIVSPVVFSGATHGANLKLRDYGAGYVKGQTRDLIYSPDLPDIIPEACLDGACFLVDADKFEFIGAFDEQLFMYSEEDDISLRLHQHGYQKLTVSKAHAQHIGGASSKPSLRLDLRKKYHQKWAVYYMLGKHQSAWARRYAAGKTLLIAPLAILTYALFLQKRHIVKWSGWLLAALDGMLETTFFRAVV